MNKKTIESLEKNLKSLEDTNLEGLSFPAFLDKLVHNVELNDEDIEFLGSSIEKALKKNRIVTQ